MTTADELLAPTPWRVGGSVPENLYDGSPEMHGARAGRPIGSMRTAALARRVVESVNQAARLLAALVEIHGLGQVCSRFDTCGHRACAASYAAWATADEALFGLRPAAEPPPTGRIVQRTALEAELDMLPLSAEGDMLRVEATRLHRDRVPNLIALAQRRAAEET